MNSLEGRESNYTGRVWPGAQHPRQFYCYSISRISPQGECLSDGVAGDIAEALASVRAHIQYQISGEGSAARSN